jgi:hypothetical protein
MDADEESEKGETMLRRKRSRNAPGMQVRLHRLIHHHHACYLTNHATTPITHTRAIIHDVDDVGARGNRDPDIPWTEVRPTVLTHPHPRLLTIYHTSTRIISDDVDGARLMSRGAQDDAIDTIDRPGTPSTPHQPPRYYAMTSR